MGPHGPRTEGENNRLLRHHQDQHRRGAIDRDDGQRHLYLLHAYSGTSSPPWRWPSAAGRKIFAPDITVEKPVYHFNMYGKTITLEGAEAVQAVYREWTRVAYNRLLHRQLHERLAVNDDMVVSRSTMYQQTPGFVLVEDGAPVDPDAMYPAKSEQAPTPAV